MPSGVITISNVNINPAVISSEEAITVSAKIRSSYEDMKKISAGLVVVHDNIRYVVAKSVSVSKVIQHGTDKIIKFNMTTLSPDEVINFTNASTGLPSSENSNVFTYMQENHIRGIDNLYLSVTYVDWETSQEKSNYPATQASSNATSVICGRVSPIIKKFDLIRCSYHSGSYVPDDEGTRTMLSLKLGSLNVNDISDTNWSWQLQQMKCRVTWLNGNGYLHFTYQNQPYIDEYIEEMEAYRRTIISTDIRLDDLITTGIEQDPNFLYIVEFNPNFDYPVVASFYDDYEICQETIIIPEAFANVHLADCGKGVAFGKFSASTDANPLFECEYKTKFDGGIDIATLFSIVETQVTAQVSSSSATLSTSATVIVPTGFTAIGVIGKKLSGNTYTTIDDLYVNMSDGKLYASGRYYGSSTSTSITITAYVLCVHTG